MVIGAEAVPAGAATVEVHHLPGVMDPVAQSTREYGAKNPAAFFYGQTFDRDEYYAQKSIASPLKLYDCCQESDGGSAVIVTTPERARDLQQPGVVIHGVAQCAASDQEQMTSFYREEFSGIPEVEKAAADAYAMSGLSPDDIDAAVFYDAFSPNVLLQLEVSFDLRSWMAVPGIPVDEVVSGDGTSLVRRAIPASSWVLDSS